MQGRPVALRALLVALTGLVSLAAIIGLFAARSYNGTHFKVHSKRPLAMDHVFNGTFSYDHKSVHWVPEGADETSDPHKKSLIYHLFQSWRRRLLCPDGKRHYACESGDTTKSDSNVPEGRPGCTRNQTIPQIFTY